MQKSKESDSSNRKKDHRGKHERREQNVEVGRTIEGGEQDDAVSGPTNGALTTGSAAERVGWGLQSGRREKQTMRDAKNGKC